MNKEELENIGYILAMTQDDPLLFVETVFNWDSYELSKHSVLEWQKDILIKVRDKLINTADAIQIAVTSGHGVGKSALVSWLILWALSTKPNTKGVVTANTENQLKTKTWAELNKWHRLSLIKPLFEVSKTAIYSAEKDYESTWRIDAITWSENRPEAFAGLHNQGGRVLLVFDEASAIPNCIWEVSEGAMTDNDTEILFFVFGNPTKTEGRFYECFGKYRHRWTTKRVDGRDVPITDKEQINKWISDYGLESDFVKVRVLGEFPSKSEDTLISTQTVERAEERAIRRDEYENAPKILGVDVARFGTDKTAIAYRQGLKLHKIDKYTQLDTLDVVARVIKAIEHFEPDAVFIDVGGVGAGVYDTLHHKGYNVTPVEFGGKATEPSKYINKRAEMWSIMSDWLKRGDIIRDEELKADLVAPRYYFKGDNTQLAIEKKQDIKRRGLGSPDSADALALTFAGKVGKDIYKNLPSKQLR